MTIAYDFNNAKNLSAMKKSGHKVNGFQHLFGLFSTGL